MSAEARHRSDFRGLRGRRPAGVDRLARSFGFRGRLRDIQELDGWRKPLASGGAALAGSEAFGFGGGSAIAAVRSRAAGSTAGGGPRQPAERPRRRRRAGVAGGLAATAAGDGCAASISWGRLPAVGCAAGGTGRGPCLLGRFQPAQLFPGLLVAAVYRDQPVQPSLGLTRSAPTVH